MNVIPSVYAETTNRMQAEPELAHHEGDDSGSFLSRFPLDQAACGTTGAELDWSPLVEEVNVPEPIARLCNRCPIKLQCRQWAIDEDAPGYWGGTTTRERRRERAIHRGNDARATRDPNPIHPGQGSAYWYKKGCGCNECRAAKAAKNARTRRRAAERAKQLMSPNP